MTQEHHGPAAADTSNRRGWPGGALLILALACAASLVPASMAGAATSVGLGTADSFAVLAGAGVTNTGPSVINGDLGTFPNPSVTGFGGAPNGTVNGTVHQADAVAASAQDDLTTAYDNAAGQGPTTTLATELGGQTLTPGVYNSASGTFGITGTLTLNAQGNPDSVFIFKTASTLITASASRVSMINGAQPCNVFWKVGSSATLDTSSVFAGNILALQSISVNDAVAVSGRLLARNGAVTLINDTVTRVPCATGGGGGDGGGGGGGGGTGGGGPGGPDVRITGNPLIPDGPGGGDDRPRCVDHGFWITVKVRSKIPMRSVKVFVDGELVRRATRKRFRTWIAGAGLSSGRKTIRVVAVDARGRRDVARERFRRCGEAAPNPGFTPTPEFTG